MGIRKLPSGAFQARIQIDGQQWSGSFATRRDAQEWTLLMQAKGISGTLPRRMTVTQYAARWMRGYELSPANTQRFHQINLDRFILPRLGPRGVSSVTPTDITFALNSVAEEVSVACADRVYRTISALFRSAADDGLTERSPARAKKHRPRRQREPQAVLERDDARRVLAAMTGWQRDTAILQLSLGARFGEIAGLTPSDVNLLRGSITIRRRVSRGTVRATKNHRFRTLELPQGVRFVCARLIEGAGAVEPLPELGDREHDSDQFHRRWLIQTSTGRSASLTAYNRALHAACADAQAPDVSSHGLRHTYVSWMIDEDHSADKIAFWIGDTPATVRAVYAHMLEASSAPAAAAIDAALGELA